MGNRLTGRGWSLAALALALTAPASAAGLLDAPVPADAPETLTAIIEIPAGGAIKYELDGGGRIFVDRFLAMPVAYPANYGSVAGSLAGDGDPLDVLVYTRSPIAPGALIRVRPIGVLRMTDGGDADQKIIAVPVSKVDSAYDRIRSVADLPGHEDERLAGFFRVYKQDSTGKTPVALSGFGDVEEAKTVLREAFAKARKPGAGKQ